MDMSERSSQLDQQREQRCGDADLLLCQKPAHCPVWLIGPNCRRQPESYSVTFLIVESIVLDDCLRAEKSTAAFRQY
jgi:hypothetical protein